MKDVQNEKDERNVSLDNVGVKDVMVPIKIKDKNKGEQHIQAKVSCYVNLEKSQKGVHMSHLVSPLFSLADSFGLDKWAKMAKNIMDKQTMENKEVKTRACKLRAEFVYFMDKRAPVSKVKSILGYDATMEILVGEGGYKSIEIKVPVSTCCPCSLELCDNQAAHNQRGIITIKTFQDINDERNIWFEDIIEAAEKAGSCPIFPVLRRPDEKFVTEEMFKNAKFVEDVVRDAVINMKEKYNDVKVFVSCENMESIHDHSAYADTIVNGE